MKKFVVAPILLVLLAGLFFLSLDKQKPADVVVEEPVVEDVRELEAWELAEVPDFPAIADVKTKKDTFFQYMLPLVIEENQRVAKQRNQLVSLQNKTSFSNAERDWLEALGRHYRHTGEINESWFAQMLLRVDTLPPSLALAQAANETGWGSSRFARQGNNYFGQWCFSKGCGLVPASRTSGSIHEVQKFDDVGSSVRAYIRNLNTHVQYSALRELRASARENGVAVTGPYLAQGLSKYSERGHEYIDEIVSMINTNRLVQFDKALDVTGVLNQ